MCCEPISQPPAFASGLSSRFSKPPEPTLLADLRKNILHLPLQTSPALTAKRAELDRLGTELWNLSTRLRRDDAANIEGNAQTENIKTGDKTRAYLLRAYAFLLLDSAGSQKVQGRERKSCIRLMKVALKAAKACILGKDLESATRVLERAATYEEILTGQSHSRRSDGDDADIAKRLQLEYFSVRSALVGILSFAPRKSYLFEAISLSARAASIWQNTCS